jgi:hypothetical protein
MRSTRRPDPTPAETRWIGAAAHLRERVLGAGVIAAVASGAALFPLYGQSSSPAEAEPVAQQPARSARTSNSVTISVQGGYHANPFNLRRHWVPAPAGSGRTRGYAAPWDVVSTADVGYTRAWQRSSRARISASAGVGYQHYSLHPQHNHASATGALSYRSPSRAQTTLSAEWSPHVLLGNRQPEGAEDFVGAYYSGYSAAVTHRQPIGSGWSIRPEVEYAQRRFDAPFAARDRQSIRLATRVTHDRGGFLAVAATGAGGHLTSTRAEGEGAVTTVRYYEGGTSLTWRPGPVELRGRARLRSLEYRLAAVGAERQDRAWTLDLRASRRVSQRMSVWTTLAGRSRTSARYLDEVLLEPTASTGLSARAGADLTF